MWRMENIWQQRNRGLLLAISVALVAAIAVIDWWTKPYISLGFLYLFPILLSAPFLPRWSMPVVGVLCAVLSDVFSQLDPAGEGLRLLFETLALAGCGLYVGEMAHNRRLTIEGQERLRILVETSPAAILTIDDRGFIELANASAIKLFKPLGALVGQPVAAFLPELHYALRREEGAQFRTVMRCRAHRANSESFLADVWFSTYKEGPTPKLAAIIAEAPDEPAAPPDPPAPPPFDVLETRVALTSRDVDVLRLLVQGFANKEISARLEVSESVVKNALQQLFAKTGVRSRSQLVRVAIEQFRDQL
jgi:two-component system sensor kinase FixL